LRAYARVTRKGEYCYIDLYAGSGSSICDGTDCLLEGAELRALTSGAKFTKYIFVVKTQSAAGRLIERLEPEQRERIAVISGSPNNKKTIRNILDLIPRSASSFAFVNPGGYRALHWQTIQELATKSINWQGEKMEFLIMFPLEMSLFRNLLRPECHASINRFYGSQRWEEIKRMKLTGKSGMREVKIKLIELFMQRLKELGYNFVEDFKPASPSRQPYYHVISASDDGSRAKILKNAWGRTKSLKCELLYKGEPAKN